MSDWTAPPPTILLRITLAEPSLVFFFFNDVQKIFMVSIKMKLTDLQELLKIAIQVKREFTKL